MKYLPLIILVILYSFGYSQSQKIIEEKYKFSVKDRISKSHPNFGPELNKHNEKTLAKGTKKITRVNYYIDRKTGEVDMKTNDTSYQEFNKKGKITSIINTQSWCSKFTYKYNNKNEVLQEVFSDCDNNIEHKIVYNYNQYKITESTNGELPNKVIYTLDKIGNKIKREDYDGKRRASYWIKEYDVNRNVIDFKLYTSDDYLEFHEIYTYGTQSELISSEVIKFPEDLTDLYDFSGNQMISYHEAKIRRYEYDEINNILTEYQLNKNKKPIEIKYSFDKFGNLIKINKTVNDSKTITTFSNQYDEYGNIIEQKYSWKGEVRYISKASIEYYK